MTRLGMASKRAFFIAGELKKTLEWSTAEFQTAISGGTVPFMSLELQVTNSTINVAYIGIRYRTASGIVNVADRLTVGGVVHNSTITFTPRSVPALAELEQDITHIYVDVTILSPIGGTVDVQAFIRTKNEVVSTFDFVGIDRWVVEAYRTTGIGATWFLMPASSNQVYLYTVPTGFRATCENIVVDMPPTPSYPGDLTVEIVSLVGNVRYFSKRFEYVSERFVCEWPMTQSEDIQITIRNLNSAVSYRVTARAAIREYY